MPHLIIGGPPAFHNQAPGTGLFTGPDGTYWGDFIEGGLTQSFTRTGSAWIEGRNEGGIRVCRNTNTLALLLEPAATNHLPRPLHPPVQSVTLGYQAYTVSITGSGSLSFTLRGTDHTITQSTPKTIIGMGETITLTPTGVVNTAQLEGNLYPTSHVLTGTRSAESYSANLTLPISRVMQFAMFIDTTRSIASTCLSFVSDDNLSIKVQTDTLTVRVDSVEAGITVSDGWLVLTLVDDGVQTDVYHDAAKVATIAASVPSLTGTLTLSPPLLMALGSAALRLPFVRNGTNVDTLSTDVTALQSDLPAWSVSNAVQLLNFSQPEGSQFLPLLLNGG